VERSGRTNKEAVFPLPLIFPSEIKMIEENQKECLRLSKVWDVRVAVETMPCGVVIEGIKYFKYYEALKKLWSLNKSGVE